MSDPVLIEALGPDRGTVAAWLLALAAEAQIDHRLIRRAARGWLVPRSLADYMVSSAPPPEAAVKMPTAELLETKIEPVTAPLPPAAAEPDRETVRAWAKAQGIEVADSGRLKAALIDQYVAAHA